MRRLIDALIVYMALSRSNGRRLVIPAIIAAVVLVLDQLAKAWVLRIWPQPYSGEIPIIDGWLALTYVQNQGIAFGLFQGMPQLFTLTSIMIVIGAVWLFLKHAPDLHEGWLSLCLGLIVGGALGNVTDRIRHGYVVDFIKTFDGRFPVFNTADIWIVTGVITMAVLLTIVEQAQASQHAAPIEAEDGR